ncbi:unnamed protein product, partial [Mycena citricolor]
ARDRDRARGGTATAVQLFLHPSYSGRSTLIRYVTREFCRCFCCGAAAVCLSGMVAADAIITAKLVVKFRAMNYKTSFKDTRNVIRRLTMASFRNGVDRHRGGHLPRPTGDRQCLDCFKFRLNRAPLIDYKQLRR